MAMGAQNEQHVRATRSAAKLGGASHGPEETMSSRARILGLADRLLRALRERARSADDRVELTARRWAHRQPRRVHTDDIAQDGNGRIR
jgi:hypothetical protein